MGVLVVMVLCAWTPFVSGSREAFFDEATGNVVTVDDSGTYPVRVLEVYADLSSASSGIASGVSTLPQTRQIGYSAALVALVGPAHHSRIVVEYVQVTGGWLSAAIVAYGLWMALTFGYWVSNQRSGN